MNKLNPNRLKEIRIMRGLTLDQIASELGISKQAVSKYEKGASQPSPETIEKIISFFKIPRSYLTKDDIPNSLLQSPLFFRTKKSTKLIKKEIAAIHVKWIYEIIESNLQQFKREVNLPTFPDCMSIEEKAFELRKAWGLGVGAINNLTEAMEYNGINILAVDTSKIICDAYSQVVNSIPIVIINQNIGSSVRWRFNLAHELGHLILHSNIDLQKLEVQEEFDKLEKEANLFAENFLMPKESFGKCIMSDKLDYFVTLKRDWKVSIEAMIYRSERLEIINERRIIQLHKQLSKRGWKRTEPLDDMISFEVPQRIQSLIRKEITDTVTADRFLTQVSLPIKDIESFLGLGKEYFENIGVSVLQYISRNEYQQLSLFWEDSIC